MKKVICIALLAAMVLSATGCGGSTDSAATSTDSGASSSATSATRQRTEKTSAKSSEVAEESDSQAEENNTVPFEFPVQCIGGYSDRNHYSENYVIVEAQKITVSNEGTVTEYDFSDCVFVADKSVIVNSNGDIVGKQQGRKIMLSAIGITLYDVGFELLIGDEEMIKYTVVNNIPMSDYVSLDGEGEFGILDVPDEIKNVIENEAGDDYIIRYHEFNGSQFYLISCFDEDELLFKQMMFTNDGNGYVREDAELGYMLYDSITDTERNICTKWFAISNPIDCLNNKFSLFSLGGASIGMVYGEHCFIVEDEDLTTCTYWVSKPISVEEGERLNALSPMLEHLRRFNKVQDETQKEVSIAIYGDASGRGVVDNINALCCDVVCYANVAASDRSYCISSSVSGVAPNITDVSYEGNTLIFSTDKVMLYDYDGYGGYYIDKGFAVIEATIDGDNLTVTFKYFADENVDLENYKNYTPDETVTSKYTK